VRFAAITLCVASPRVFVVVYFVIDSVRKLLDTPSYLIKLLTSVDSILLIWWLVFFFFIYIVCKLGKFSCLTRNCLYFSKMFSENPNLLCWGYWVRTSKSRSPPFYPILRWISIISIVSAYALKTYFNDILTEQVSVVMNF
jgi:hypothetical protein